MAAEGVDQVQLRVRAQCLAQGERRGPLIHPDLDHPPRGPRHLQQYRGVLGGVHRARRDQAHADRERAQTHVVAQAIGRQTAQAGGQDRHRSAPYALPQSDRGDLLLVGYAER